jgi:hypothetical protein
MNGLYNGLYDGLNNGSQNGLFDGLNNGLDNGLYSSDIGFDIDANRFIIAAEITSPIQKIALTYLVKNLKSLNIWSKLIAIYPFIGGTATTHKFNLKNPRDLNAAFRLTFLGGWTHSQNGALPNGTNANADTYINVVSHLSQNNLHFSIYSRSNTTSNSVSIWNQTTGGNPCQLYTRFSNNFYSRVNDSGATGPVTTNNDSRGFFISNRVSSIETRNFINKNLFIGSHPSTGTVSNSFTLAGGSIMFDNRQYAFSTFGQGLTDTDAVNLYNIVQNYQTLLGRQV